MPENLKRDGPGLEEICLSLNIYILGFLLMWNLFKMQPYIQPQIVPQAQFPFLFPKIHQYPLSFSRLTFLLNLILQGNIILQNII